NRKAIDWKLVVTGMSIQLIFAILVLKVPFVKDGFNWVAGGFVLLLDFSKSGAEFMFSGLVTNTNTFGYIFAFQILPTIVFFSALMSILYYLGLLQRLVYGIAWVMSKTMRLSGAESLSAAGNIFLGQTEAPLLIKPYLEKMTKSEMLSVMAGGMANIAGGVFAAYIGYLGGDDPVQQQIFATHLLTASILSAPAAMVSAKMLLPQTEEIDKDLNIPRDRIGTNLLEAISIGTGDGLRLAVNVGVMLMVFTSLIFMFNFLVADKFGAVTGLNAWVESVTQGRYHQFNLQYIFGLLFAPVAWLLGVPADDMMVVGQLLGEKTIINEFVAYASLGTQKAAGVITHYKSVIIATYALCGFANFASIGIQIGGIGALAPGKRAQISQLGIKALIGGTLASFYTASIAGMMISL
ncbi:MAG: Na+ dependent nucleoside transporter, partial [Bacteroidetes bacterium]